MSIYRMPRFIWESWQLDDDFYNEINHLANQYDEQSQVIVKNFVNIMKTPEGEFSNQDDCLIFNWEFDKYTLKIQNSLAKSVHEQERKFCSCTDIEEVDGFVTGFGIDIVLQRNPDVHNYIDGNIIVDCGAYIGDSAICFQTRFTESVIWAFEIDPSNAKKFRNNLQYFEFPNKIKIFEQGLGREHSVVPISMMDTRSRLSEYGPSAVVSPLDDFTPSKPVHLIKMDIEGSEQEALAGAIHTIESQRPVLLISMYHSPEQFLDILKYGQKLKNMCYDVFISYASFGSPFCDIELMGIPKLF